MEDVSTSASLAKKKIACPGLVAVSLDNKGKEDGEVTKWSK
jgi:hypothetical protein